jgi:hypothetical protein
VYKNPHSETKGGNHRLFKEWKQRYGADNVKAWVNR